MINKFILIAPLFFICVGASSVNMKDVPTSIKINDKWVLPRGGTIEMLLNKGYKIDPEKPHVLKPDPLHPKYKELIASLKPRYAPSRGFNPKTKTGSLTPISFSGEVYRLEKPHVWIRIDDTYIKISNRPKSIFISSHRNMTQSPIAYADLIK